MQTFAIQDKLRDQTYLRSHTGQIDILHHDQMSQAKACYRFMQNALDGEFDINLIAASSRSKKIYLDKLKMILPRLGRFQQVYVPGFSYQPSIALFLDQYRLHPISKLLDSGLLQLGTIPTDATLEVFVDFIRTLKIQAREQRLGRKIADYDAKITKNKKRLRIFESKLFRRYSRVVIVRLDLEYHASRFSQSEIWAANDQDATERMIYNEGYRAGEPLEGGILPPVRIGFDEVQHDRVKLFANMKGKPSLFRHLVGYVWRIEYGHRAGYHLHLVLVFDGAYVHKHAWLAQEIGKYWEEVIAPGRGRFHNCNADWDKNSSLYGLGSISWNDDQLRENFRERVLPYLAKPEQLVLAIPYPGCKLMGSGFVHRKSRNAGAVPDPRCA